MSWTRTYKEEWNNPYTSKVLSLKHPENLCELEITLNIHYDRFKRDSLDNYKVSVTREPIIKGIKDQVTLDTENVVGRYIGILERIRITRGKYEAIINSCPKTRALDKLEKLHDSYNNQLKGSLKQTDRLSRFLNIFICSFDLQGSQLHGEIFQFCGLSQPEEVVKNEFNAHLDKNDIDAAIALAKKYDKSNATHYWFWRLLQLVEKRASETPPSIDPTFLLICYKAVEPEAHRDYQDAQKKIFELLHSMEADSEEEFSLLKEKIISAIKTRQMWLANQYLNELCGLPLGATNFTLGESTVNLETIFEMAKFIRESRKPEITAVAEKQGAIQAAPCSSPSPEPSASTSPRLFRNTDNDPKGNGESSPSSKFS